MLGGEGDGPGPGGVGGESPPPPLVPKAMIIARTTMMTKNASQLRIVCFFSGVSTAGGASEMPGGGLACSRESGMAGMPVPDGSVGVEVPAGGGFAVTVRTALRVGALFWASLFTGTVFFVTFFVVVTVVLRAADGTDRAF